MATIEHDIAGDEDAEISLTEEFPSSAVLQFDGNGSDLHVSLDHDQLQRLTNLLGEWGYKTEYEPDCEIDNAPAE